MDEQILCGYSLWQVFLNLQPVLTWHSSGWYSFEPILTLTCSNLTYTNPNQIGLLHLLKIVALVGSIHLLLVNLNGRHTIPCAPADEGGRFFLVNNLTFILWNFFTLLGLSFLTWFKFSMHFLCQSVNAYECCL